jgi:hypothetical protein
MLLSNYFRVESVRDENKAAEFSAGNLVLEELIPQKKRNQSNFIPDEAILKNYKFVLSI